MRKVTRHSYHDLMYVIPKSALDLEMAGLIMAGKEEGGETGSGWVDIDELMEA